MLSKNKIIQKFSLCSLMALTALGTVQAQNTQPRWWFGASGAANSNFYSGTTQRLNNSLIVPSAFHEGTGFRPFASLFLEYRPAGALGLMLNAGYDNRGAKYDGVIAACDCPATLSTTIDYITIEPSLRLGLPSSKFYLFAGPRVAFSQQEDFKYTQLRQPDTDSELSAMRKTVISGQVGLGYEFPISSPASSTQVNLSPFVSYHPYFGQDPRDIESLSISTVRTGIALKFGKARKAPVKDEPLAEVPARQVTFAVRGPVSQSIQRQVSETLPLRNSVFFDEGSTQIPGRYIVLTADQASAFKETVLEQQPQDGGTGRAARQLNVYHHILNILGDRLRSNEAATISLIGASANGPAEGKELAKSVKDYLVSVFGVSASRIEVQGRTKPLIPSEQPGATKELTLLRAGDRRVDIQSNSPELLMEVGGSMLKPVQIVSNSSALDSQVVLNVDGAMALLKNWSVDIIDESGKVMHRGPFTNDQESMTVASILGDRAEGNYKVNMTAETKSGLAVTKEGVLSLKRPTESVIKAFRYSILFDFNKPESIAKYKSFLTDVVSPQVTAGSTVIVHGHTDVIGDAGYNQSLSEARANDTQKTIESALLKAGTMNVKFQTSGFGEDSSRSPFENNLPEERFYNRTVIIEIVPAK